MSGETLRILLTADVVGGVGSYAATLAGALVERGHSVHVAVVGADSRPGGLPEEVEVATSPLRLEWMKGGVEDRVAVGEWLAGLVDRWEPDLVHLNQFCYAAYPLGAPTLVVGHSDVLSWWSEVLREEAPPEWNEYARAVRHGLAAADAVVTPSRYQSDLLRRHYGQAAHHVVHNGAAPSPAGEGEGERGGSVMTAGRAWDAAKGVRVLDEALALMRDAAPHALLLGDTTGPGGDTVHLERVEALGSRTADEVRRQMRRSAVYVGPSLYEPFGLAPLEAALEGCPLLLSDIGSFRELWDGCAEFVPPGDAQALAAALRRLIDDPGRCREMARLARERALDRYGVAGMAERYLEIYRALLPAPAPEMQTIQPR